MSENTGPSPEELGKKKFEVKMRSDGAGGIEKAIFIGDEMLDWQIDTNAFMDAMKMGPQYVRAVQRSIEEHFIESVSDFIGRKVTMLEIKKAIETGWI
jgi:carbon monoxide dehydrogenase subunit G